MAPPAGAEAPAGREYAQLLAQVTAEAQSAGAQAPGDRPAEDGLRSRIRQQVEGIARRHEGSLPEGIGGDRLVRDAVAELAGTGALEIALEDEQVTTVAVEPSGRVLLGRNGELSPSALWFSSEAALLSAVDRLLGTAGIARPPEMQVIDTALPGGLQLFAVLGLAASSGATVVLERAPAQATTLSDLVTRELLSAEAAQLLEQSLGARRNIIVSGPIGSGRSTLVGALAEAVASSERCVLVEARPSLGRALPQCASIGGGEALGQALRIALRMRPRRLVVDGADEGGAAATLLASLATGAEGTLLTVQGAAPGAALASLASQAAGDSAVLRDELLASLASTRPLVVQLGRLADGASRVVSIAEVRGYEGQRLLFEESYSARGKNALR